MRGHRFEAFLARLMKQRIIACGRCGWRGRMKVEGDVPVNSKRVLTYPSDIPPVDDQDEPDLAKLDKALEKATNPAAPKKKRAKSTSERKT